MPASLTIATGASKNKVFLQSAKTIVGRGAQSDVQIEDESVTGAGFAIIRTQTGYALKSLAAEGGTAVNGKAVKQAMLKTGDVISLGNTKILFAADGAGQTAAGPAPTTRAVKPATGAVRKATTAIEKPSSTSRMTPKPATGRTSAVSKTSTTRATGAVQKPATGAVRKGTGRIEKPATGRSATRRGGARSKAIDRVLHGKKRSPLPAVLLLVVAVGVIGGLGWYFSGGGSDENSGKKSVAAAQALIQEAFVAETEKGDLDEAMKLLEEALKHATAAGEDGSGKKAEAEAAIKVLQGKIVTVQRAQTEFEGFKKTFDAGLPKTLDEGRTFHQKLDDLRKQYVEMQKLCKWYAESGTMLEALAEHNLKLEKMLEDRGWKPFKRDTVDPLVKEGKFAEAYAKIQARLSTFIATDQDEVKTYLQNEFESKAAEAWEKLKSEARKFRPDGFDKAKELIAARQPDFDSTKVAAQMVAAIKKLDAKDWNLD